MKKSSESGSLPSGNARVLRISPLGKLDERKLKVGAKAFKRGPNADYFDLGTLVWSKIREVAEIASATSSDPYLRSFPSVAKKIADSSETLPEAEDLAVAYFSLGAACREFQDRMPGWKVSLSMGLLNERNGYDANEIDLADAYGLEDGFDSDPFFKAAWNEISNLPDFETYESVVFDFFWPAGLYQAIPLANRLKRLGKRTVLNFTRANEQADFTQWIESFKANPELFDRFDAVVVYEDYGYALETVLRTFAEGGVFEDGTENVVFRKGAEIVFKKPGAVQEDELRRRFESYFHGSSKDRKIAGRKIATVRLFPYKCYWSSCFFCTINSTHLYAYRKNASEYVDSCLDFVEKNGIGYLYLADEAIHPDDILDFAKKVLERGIDLVYRFRARFDTKFDSAACELLSKSGARYVGVGLECASDRVSDMINKGNEISLVEKTEIIGNFEAAGIPFHNYAILGLPGERQDEMYETYLFLSKNVRVRDNYTCSPNVFGLNKGSVFEKHTEKFGVETKSSESVKTSLQLRVEMVRSALFSEAQKQFSQELHRQQFLEFCSKELVDGGTARDFWDFVDRTGLFYHLKSFSKESPFRKPLREAETELRKTDAELFSARFSASPYLRNLGQTGKTTNIATGHSVGLPLEIFINWKPGASPETTLGTNVSSDELRKLVEYRFILPFHG